MIFGRRNPPDWKENLRISLWPRRSWGRSAKYVVNRMLRLSGTPHAVALGSAAGVLASFTPYMGFHFVVAGIIAWLVRGNLLASALGTFFGNPLTFPFIWFAAYNTGNFLMGHSESLGQGEIMTRLGEVGKGLFSGSWQTTTEVLGTLWPTILLPMTLGGLLVGSFVAFAWYFLIYKLIVTYNEAKKARLAKIKSAQHEKLANQQVPVHNKPS